RAAARVGTGNVASLTPAIRDPLTGQPFAGGIIPTNRIVNPVAKALFANPSLYPLPNVTQSALAHNYLTTDGNKIDGHQFDVKIDHRFSDRSNISGRYS